MTSEQEIDDVTADLIVICGADKSHFDQVKRRLQSYRLALWAKELEERQEESALKYLRQGGH